MSPFKGLDLVWVPVTHMERAVGFYRDVLGFHVVQVSPFWSTLRCGDLTLGLHGPDCARDREPDRAGWVVCLVTDDVEGVRNRLSVAGAAHEATLHETPRGYVLSFWDPDGNHLQAIQLKGEEPGP